MAFILVLPNVYSFDTWTTSVSLCDCGIDSQELYIFNTGKDNTFLIDISGDAKNWVSLSDNSIFLESGERTSVSLNYKVPCGGKDSNIIFKVTPLGEQSKELNQKLIVNECSNIQIIPIKTFDIDCPCKELEYQFKIKNTGSFQEKYTFDSSKFKEEMIFIPSTVLLNPGQEVVVTAVLKAECKVSGKYSYDINVLAEYNELKTSFSVGAEIKPCYGYSLSAGEIGSSFESQQGLYNVCVGTENSIPLLITNDADFNNSYDLSLRGKFATLQNKNVEIGSSKSILTNILFNPANVGNYTLFLESKSKLGKLKGKFKLPIIVEDCYNLEIIMPSKVEVNSSIVPILLKNTGTKELNALIAVSGSEFVSVDNGALTINGEKVINLVLQDPGKSLVENVKVSVQLDNGDVKNKNLKLVFGKPFFYTYGVFIILGIIILIILIIFIVYVISKRPKKEKIKKEKRIKSIDRIKETVIENKTKKKVKDKSKEKKNSGSGFKIFLFVALILLILIFIFSLPIQTVSPNLSERQVGKMLEQKWPVNKILRTDLNELFSNSSLNLQSSDKVNVQMIGKVAYLYPSSNWTGSNFLDLIVNNKSEKVFFTIEGAVNETYFQQGTYVYGTLSYLVYDYVRIPIVLIIVVLVIILIIFIIFKAIKSKNKPKKSKKNKDTRLTTIVVK